MSLRQRDRLFVDGGMNSPTSKRCMGMLWTLMLAKLVVSPSAPLNNARKTVQQIGGPPMFLAPLLQFFRYEAALLGAVALPNEVLM